MAGFSPKSSLPVNACNTAALAKEKVECPEI